MQEKLNIAVFVDYDNIEIGVKSTLRRDFHVAPVLDALKERGIVVAKFAYANWSRQEGATRQMAENAVQMVQRIPSPRGDKNGADINLALDALEMAFTHKHIHAFAIISGDSDFIPLVNKLKEYGKTVFIVGGKAFTSTILQQNCHEFISYESLLSDSKPPERQRGFASGASGSGGGQQIKQERRPRSSALDLTHAMPLVERAIDVLQRREVQPQLGLLKSTMLQLSPTFSERDYGSSSFSGFMEALKAAGHINLTGTSGKLVIELRETGASEVKGPSPEDALPALREVVARHARALANGVEGAQMQLWVSEEAPQLDWQAHGFQEFAELLNFAQDRSVIRVEPDEERGLVVFAVAEPAAAPPAEAAPAQVAPAQVAPGEVEGSGDLAAEPEPGGDPRQPRYRSRRRRKPEGALRAAAAAASADSAPVAEAPPSAPPPVEAVPEAPAAESAAEPAAKRPSRRRRKSE